MATYLDRILDRHRAEAAADERRTEDLVQAAGGTVAELAT